MMAHIENSDAATVSKNLALYILYYCHIHGDNTKYTLNLKGVADINYSLDEYDTQSIAVWKLPYAQPKFETLQGYKLRTVRKWYRRTYEIPAQILSFDDSWTFPQINTEDMQDMATCELVFSPTVPIVFNTTYKKLFYFDRDLRGWKPLQ